MKFNLVAVGGTFDHLHLGHKKLLQTARLKGKKVIVGLCRPSMLNKKLYPQSIEAYFTRRQNLNNLGFQNIIPLTDIYGPAATNAAIEAIICSPLSRPNAEKINSRRRKPLAVIEVPLIQAGDGQRISSSRIRQGLINRQGFSYASIFNQNLILPQSLRPKLQQPFAGLTKTAIRPRHGLITVGDIATVSFTRKQIIPDLAVVDLKSKRKKVFPRLEALGIKLGLSAPNPAGTITKQAASTLLDCLNQHRSSLLIDGEEDLLVLPAILFAPLKTTIYYGQPNRAMVKVIVTETAKDKTLKFLQQFTSPNSNPKFFAPLFPEEPSWLPASSPRSSKHRQSVKLPAAISPA